jgi:hypothetical protein
MKEMKKQTLIDAVLELRMLAVKLAGKAPAEIIYEGHTLTAQVGDTTEQILLRFFADRLKDASVQV